MKITKHTAVTVVLILTCVSSARAVTSAEIGAQFLQISPSPRASSMGDAYVAQAKSADSVFYNPASSVFIPDMSLSSSYVRWIEGINYLSLFASMPLLPSMSVGAGLLGLTTGGIPETMDFESGGVGLSGDSFSASDFCGLLNYSWRFLPDFSLGANLKFIFQSFSSARSFSFASDMGVFFTMKKTGFSAGLVLLNLGTPAKFDSYDAGLPLSVKIGGSYNLDLSRQGGFLTGLLFAGEAWKTSGESISFSGGLESVFGGLFMLRAGYGYQEKSDSTGFTAGAGINITKFNSSFAIRNFQINYGLGFFSNLGLTHAFQVNMAFRSGPRNDD